MQVDTFKQPPPFSCNYRVNHKMVFINQTKLCKLRGERYTPCHNIFTLFLFQFKYFVVKACAYYPRFLSFSAVQ